VVAVIGVRRTMLGSSVLFALLGCAPLTFSEPSAIDFDTYRSVFVDVNPGEPDARLSEHLADELRESSGFERVTTDPNEAVDLLLTVELYVDVTITEDDDGTSVEYDGVGEFTARTPSGAVVDRGAEDDSSISYDETQEDVLDEIALHYLAPYRL
jgi:hypothetical protein